MFRKAIIGPLALAALTASGFSQAVTVDYSSTSFVCNQPGTCELLASLDEIENDSTLVGSFDIIVPAGGTFTGADVNLASIDFLLTDPNGSMQVGDTPPFTSNPLALNDVFVTSVVADGTWEADGSFAAGSFVALELAPPLTSLQTWVDIALDTGAIRVCGFYNSGSRTCTINVAEFQGTLSAPIPVPAAAWLFGSALMGLVGLRRRKS